MEHVSSEIQDDSPKDGSTGSAASISAPLCDHTFTGDVDLRCMIEENAFQALTGGSLIKRPRYTFCVSEPDEHKDFLSLTFPRKLWKIVESDQFKSIRWDEKGTSIVIDEELLKKEVLERKVPFRILETGSMKSLVCQLNLYGFSKMPQSLQRSASLADSLIEEKEISVLSKIQYYHNPYFKRGCPQLLVGMKRRVGIKSSSKLSLVQEFNKKPCRAGNNVDNLNSGFVAETSGESVCSNSTNVNVPLIRKPSPSQRIATTTDPMRRDFSPASAMSIRPSEQIGMEKHAILNQLTPFHMHPHSSYTQANGHIVNFVTTTTSTSQYRIISPLQSSYFGEMVGPSNFPTRYADLSASEARVSNLELPRNTWFTMPMIGDTSAASLSRSTPQPSPSYAYQPNYK
ncbi:PREDICTED: heat shock transcription factor, Y-linked-like [Odobenus rosmarus divergens]|uniref:Heat shock transcription factor, Y-linked-like n=1 Tax=Odobenus rosmarus divergens TaxID=9708 RepID=A0A2U3WSX6_ODORO|nr:PREDICTED: heat shock transcription factor, Y-linked-like [Odobenus rosmarus divergens]